MLSPTLQFLPVTLPLLLLLVTLMLSCSHAGAANTDAAAALNLYLCESDTAELAWALLLPFLPPPSSSPPCGRNRHGDVHHLHVQITPM